MNVSRLPSGSIGRRQVVQGLVAMFSSAALASDARGQKTVSSMPIVRVSRGSFAPEKYETIKSRLDASQKSLLPAIRRLSGCTADANSRPDARARGGVHPGGRAFRAPDHQLRDSLVSLLTIRRQSGPVVEHAGLELEQAGLA